MATSPGNVDTTASQQQGRILLVDDEVNILKTFRFCLEDVGYQVSTARSVAEATALVQQDVFELAFLDLRLGNDSGLDLVPVFTSQAPWMKIVIITAYSSIESAVEAIRMGAADYLAKPFTDDELVGAIEKSCERLLKKQGAAL